MGEESRYQREIEEILGRVNENASTRGGKKARVAFRAPASRPLKAPHQGDRPAPLVTPGRLLVGGILLLMVALFLNNSVPFWIGLAAIVAAYFVFFSKPKSPVEKRWRGQSIEEGLANNAPSRVWRWIKRG